MTEKALKGRQEYMAQWRARNREHIRKYEKQWRLDHPDKVAAINNRFWEKKADELEASGQ